MVKKQAIGLVLVVASSCPALSHALSLGEIEFNSRVNQPFKARIELLQATEQELAKLQVHVAPPSIFAQAQLARPAFMDSLKFARSVKNGKNYLVISSSQPIADAEFNLLLEVTSPKGDLLKRYAVALAKPSPAVLPEAIEQQPAEPTPATAELTDASDEPSVAAIPALASTAASLERSVRVRPTVPKVAIALPKLAFKHRYRVRKTDSIFSIAERLKIGQLNVDEKVLALYARNPKAFTNGDLNQLKVGAVLRTPGAVAKRRVTVSAPIVVQAAAEPKHRQAAQRKVLKSAVVSLTPTPVVTNAALTVDPPLVQALREQQHASELKLADLQARLSQAQDLLDSRTLENTELKALVQEKNRLLTRHEEELNALQAKVDQDHNQAQAVLAAGIAGPKGQSESLISAEHQSLVSAENTWQGVFNSPLVWKMTALSSLFLVLVALWQKRRSEDQFMQFSVQNAILSPDDYADEEDQGSVLDFLWAEDELERAREQLQNLRYSMASLREQSQRLQAYLHPESMSTAS